MHESSQEKLSLPTECASFKQVQVKDVRHESFPEDKGGSGLHSHTRQQRRSGRGLPRRGQRTLDRWPPDSNFQPHVYVPEIHSIQEVLGYQRLGINGCGGLRQFVCKWPRKRCHCMAFFLFLKFFWISPTLRGCLWRLTPCGVQLGKKTSFVSVFWGCLTTNNSQITHVRVPDQRVNVSVVLQVEAEDGTCGVGITIGGEPGCFIVEKHLSRFVEGQDPRDVEIMWEQMFRATLNYGRKGLPLQAISAVDLALWDLLGKLRNEPVISEWHLLFSFHLFLINSHQFCFTQVRGFLAQSPSMFVFLFHRHKEKPCEPPNWVEPETPNDPLIMTWSPVKAQHTRVVRSFGTHVKPDCWKSETNGASFRENKQQRYIVGCSSAKL